MQGERGRQVVSACVARQTRSRVPTFTEKCSRVGSSQVPVTVAYLAGSSKPFLTNVVLYSKLHLRGCRRHRAHDDRQSGRVLATVLEPPFSNRARLGFKQLTSCGLRIPRGGAPRLFVYARNLGKKHSARKTENAVSVRRMPSGSDAILCDQILRVRYSRSP